MVSNDGLEGMKATVGLFRQGANLLDTEIKAISEIIKNSYDADATNVVLNMKDAFKPRAQNPQILIKDNGHGMSLDDFNKKWFVVGTSVNKQELFSPNQRARQGGKGLGRLGAWKIGERVTVYSSKKGHEPMGVCIDISALTDGQLFDDIKPELVQGADAYFPRGEYGTIIHIQKFNKQLTGATIFCQNMTRSLLLLQNPFDGLTDFKITPSYPSDSVVDMVNFSLQELASQALYHADLEINGDIIEGTFTNNNKYSDDYQKTKDFYKKLDNFSGSLLGSIEVKIRAFQGDSNLYRYTRVLPGSNQALGKDKFEKLTGFRLYKDGIRVAPYGEPNNDWLGLDDVKYAGNSIFQNKRLIAMANYEGLLNPGLAEVAARNGLIKNTSYHALVALLNLAVKELRKWANPIINAKPQRFTAPDLHYSRLDVEPSASFTSVSPTNVGGKPSKLTASCVSITNLKVTKDGVVSGSAPPHPGEYNITVSSNNDHGSRDSVFVLHVQTPSTLVSPPPHVPAVPAPLSGLDDDPGKNNTTAKNTLSKYHTGLLRVVSDIADGDKKQKLEEILTELHDLISEL